jgi:hypothetical protein
VQITLAAERRDDPERQENWQVYQSLRPHLEPAGSLDSDDPQVHALVIDMVRYLRARNDLLGSQELAQRAIDSWRPRLGENHHSVLRVRSELATTLQALGSYTEGLSILEEIIPRLARTLGDKHPYTLVAHRTMAGHLRGLGRYRDARQLDVDWPSQSGWSAISRRRWSSTRRPCGGATRSPAPPSP